MNNLSPSDFVRDNTTLTTAPLLPEITLHLATEVTPLWMATEETLAEKNLPPPYWAFAWPGGQAVARLLLDRPDLVAGKSVLDFAAGTGIVGIAAMKAGAARVQACEIDRFALAAIRLNAEANGVEVKPVSVDLIGRDLPGIDIVLAGDVCYEKPMAEKVTVWLRQSPRPEPWCCWAIRAAPMFRPAGWKKSRPTRCRPPWNWKTAKPVKR